MITAGSILTYKKFCCQDASWFLGDCLGSMWADFKTVTLIFTVDDSFMFYETQPHVLKHTRTVVVWLKPFINSSQVSFTFLYTTIYNVYTAYLMLAYFICAADIATLRWLVVRVLSGERQLAGVILQTSQTMKFNFANFNFGTIWHNYSTRK